MFMRSAARMNSGIGEQDVAVEQAVEDLLGGGAEIETGEQKVQDRRRDHRVPDRQAERAEQDDRDDAEGEGAERHAQSASRAGSVAGAFAPRMARYTSQQ